MLILILDFRRSCVQYISGKQKLQKHFKMHLKKCFWRNKLTFWSKNQITTKCCIKHQQKYSENHANTLFHTFKLLHFFFFDKNVCGFYLIFSLITHVILHLRTTRSCVKNICVSLLTTQSQKWSRNWKHGNR